MSSSFCCTLSRFSIVLKMLHSKPARVHGVNQQPFMTSVSLWVSWEVWLSWAGLAAHALVASWGLANLGWPLLACCLLVAEAEQQERRQRCAALPEASACIDCYSPMAKS